MSEFQALQHALVIAAILFGLGLVGFFVRRNMIVMFLCVELMLQGVSLALVAWSRLYGQWDGQMLVTFIISVAACEAAIALVLVLMLCQYSGSLDIAGWQNLREESVRPFVDQEVPEEAIRADQKEWPILTPAGIEPKKSTEEPLHRSHV
jgi:NADH-quinone oxidoreductase subunit K